MEIQDAMKETGKARRIVWDKSNYIFIGEHGTFETSRGLPYSHTNICDNEWQSYPLVKQTVPKEAGENWENKKGEVLIILTLPEEEGLHFTYVNDAGCPVRLTKMIWAHQVIHGQNGWRRVFPAVNDIVIKGVTWFSTTVGVIAPIMEPDEYEWANLVDKPKMTMTLTEEV